MVKKVIKFWLEVSITVFDFLIQSKSDGKTDSAQHALIVRVDNIGDFVLWMPSAKILCDRMLWKYRRILVCNKTCVDLAQASGLFEDVVGVDLGRLVRDLRYRCWLLRKISGLGAQLAIQPTYSRAFLTGDSLIRASGAKRRIGSAGDLSNIGPWRKAISDRWYTSLVPASSRLLMELERNAEFLRGLGIPQARAEIPTLPRLASLSSGKRLCSQYFVLFPGASSNIKQWPVESFAATAKHVLKKFGWTAVACGSPSERKLSGQLVRLVDDSRMLDFSGVTSLAELVEVLRGACLVVSNDTAAIHIAAGVGVPSVCILGGGHYGRFLPYPRYLTGVKPVPVVRRMSCFNCNWQCKWSLMDSEPYPCVREIGVNEVIAAIDEAVSNRMDSIP